MESIGDCPLTETEREILRFLSDGLTQEEIGGVRGTSKNTTRNQVNVIRLKMNSNNATQSVATALREGWIE